MGSIARVLCCIFLFNLSLSLYLNRQTRITELGYELPQVEDHILLVREQNAALHYQIACFESPVHLLELLRQPAFGHLHFVTEEECISIE